MGLAVLKVRAWGRAVWPRAPGGASGATHFGRALCALAASAALATLLTDPTSEDAGVRAATVTAQPPLEAVPAAPAGPAAQSKLRRCAAAARAKHLHGGERDAFVKSCMTLRSAARGSRASTSRSAARPAHSSAASH